MGKDYVLYFIFIINHSYAMGATVMCTSKVHSE